MKLYSAYTAFFMLHGQCRLNCWRIWNNI